MAVTAKMYPSAGAYLGGGTAAAGTAIDYLSDTINVGLVLNYSFDANDVFWSDISGEITGTGYTAGGSALTSKTVAVSGTVVTYDAADTTWPTSTLAATGAIAYKASGAAGSSPLIMYEDFGGTVSTTAGLFTIAWAAAGLFTFSTPA